MMLVKLKPCISRGFPNFHSHQIFFVKLHFCARFRHIFSPNFLVTFFVKFYRQIFSSNFFVKFFVKFFCPTFCQIFSFDFFVKFFHPIFTSNLFVKFFDEVFRQIVSLNFFVKRFRRKCWFLFQKILFRNFGRNWIKYQKSGKKRIQLWFFLTGRTVKNHIPACCERNYSFLKLFKLGLFSKIKFFSCIFLVFYCLRLGCSVVFRRVFYLENTQQKTENLLF